MRRLYCCLFILMSMISTGLHAMVTVSTNYYCSYRMDDHTESISSSQPVELSAAYEVQAIDTGQVRARTFTGFSENIFKVNVSIQSEDPWMFANSVQARIEHVFIPESPVYDFYCTGFSGDHADESGSYYILTDLDSGTVDNPFILDVRTWTYEIGQGFIDDALPFQSQYTFQLDHQYGLTIGTYGQLGDLRAGYAGLELAITSIAVVPAPAGLWLLAIGAILVVGGRTPKPLYKWIPGIH